MVRILHTGFDRHKHSVTAAYAPHLCGKGEVERAGIYVGEASKAFPAIRLQMLEDSGLAGLFGG